MIAALAEHAFRAITFRHNGAGLSSKNLKVLAIAATLSVALAYARWGIPLQSVAHGAMILIMAAVVSPALGIGYALLSVGIDTIAIPAEIIHGGEIRLFFWWEMLAGLWLVLRLGKRRSFSS